MIDDWWLIIYVEMFIMLTMWFEFLPSSLPPSRVLHKSFWVIKLKDKHVETNLRCNFRDSGLPVAYQHKIVNIWLEL